MKIEAIKQVVEGLTVAKSCIGYFDDEVREFLSKSMSVLRAVIEHSEGGQEDTGQKPAIKVERNNSGQIYLVDGDGNPFDVSEHVGAAFYAHPRRGDWTGLTNKEIIGHPDDAGAKFIAESIAAINADIKRLADEYWARLDRIRSRDTLREAPDEPDARAAGGENEPLPKTVETVEETCPRAIFMAASEIGNGVK